MKRCNSIPSILGGILYGLLSAFSFTANADSSPQKDLFEAFERLDETPAFAKKAVFTDLSRAGGSKTPNNRLVAVGERGYLLLSDDEGKSWQPRQLHFASTLTAVSFPTKEIGFVTGHGGIVLKTVDGGESWEQVLNGVKAGQIELASAQQAADPTTRKGKLRLREAQHSAKFGAEKPFLDIRFDDPLNGLVVGAYGNAFTTDDGGRSWQSIIGKIPNSAGMHLYAIHQHQGATFIAGEQGSLFRRLSPDAEFEKIPTPYEGSYFGMLSTSDKQLIIYGLRGHAFITADRGHSWQQLDIPTPVTLTAGTSLEDGRVLLANESGQLFIGQHSAADKLTFTVAEVPQPAAFTAMLEADKGDLIVSGSRGVLRMPVKMEVMP